MRSLLFFSFLLSILSIPCRSQTGKTGIGIHVGAVDFYGPQTGRYLLNEYRPGDTMKHGSRLFWEPNIAVSIQRIIHPHGVWSVQASFLRVHYPSSHPDSLYILHKQGFLPSLSTPYYFPLQSTLSYSLFSFSRNRKINALVSGGIGYTAGRVQIPVGISVLVRVAPRWRVEWSSAYWIKANDWAVPGISYSLALVKFSGKGLHKKKSIQDSDGDGIADTEDGCPLMAGLLSMHGCPDTDGDGITDSADHCPGQKGFLSMMGCPDSDSDGIADPLDQCPDRAGLGKWKGCPPPDRDQDGFDDESDECPDLFCTSNRGCPGINRTDLHQAESVSKGVLFARGSAELLKTSYAALDTLVHLLLVHNDYLLDIEGHTDNAGLPDDNLQLSQERADACKAYLVKKGVQEDRISSVGYGDLKPVQSNETEAGRAANRRTEFHLIPSE